MERLKVGPKFFQRFSCFPQLRHPRKLGFPSPRFPCISKVFRCFPFLPKQRSPPSPFVMDRRGSVRPASMPGASSSRESASSRPPPKWQRCSPNLCAYFDPLGASCPDCFLALYSAEYGCNETRSTNPFLVRAFRSRRCSPRPRFLFGPRFLLPFLNYCPVVRHALHHTLPLATFILSFSSSLKVFKFEALQPPRKGSGV